MTYLHVHVLAQEITFCVLKCVLITCLW